MTVIPRCQNYHIARLANCDSALAFGNIDTNCVHETIPFIELQRPRPASLIAYSIYWVIHTNTRFNLRKTNAANEEPVGRLVYGRESLEVTARPIASPF